MNRSNRFQSMFQLLENKKKNRFTNKTAKDNVVQLVIIVVILKTNKKWKASLHCEGRESEQNGLEWFQN